MPCIFRKTEAFGYTLNSSLADSRDVVISAVNNRAYMTVLNYNAVVYFPLPSQNTTPPTVVATDPLNGARDVVVSNNIIATFSEAMKSSTITTSTFTVNNGMSNIGGVVTCSGTTATFRPSATLSSSKTYTVTITTGVTDAAGNAMAANYTWSFKTVNTAAGFVANAGIDQLARRGSVITLDGSRSFSPEEKRASDIPMELSFTAGGDEK